MLNVLRPYFNIFAWKYDSMQTEARLKEEKPVPLIAIKFEKRVL